MWVAVLVCAGHGRFVGRERVKVDRQGVHDLLSVLADETPRPSSPSRRFAMAASAMSPSGDRWDPDEHSENGEVQITGTARGATSSAASPARRGSPRVLAATLAGPAVAISFAALGLAKAAMRLAMPHPATRLSSVEIPGWYRPRMFRQ
jgi:hypothetical protein